MVQLEKLRKKKKKIVVGLMSGTSVDGVDTAIVEISNNGFRTKIKQIAFDCHKYPSKLKQFILKNSDPATARLDEIAKLNFLLGRYFADAVIKTCKRYNITISNVDLIGSHGQTIFHSPKKSKLFGKSIFATMQIADPSVIAKLTGITTVGDFRIADIAVGGTGAPLVPYFDFVFFKSKNKNIGVLNIGGIANITVIPKNATLENIFAFDTGPGNMMLDYMARKFFNLQYDKNGKIAASGEINYNLLNYLMHHKYLRIKPPKSCGREIFGENFIKEILSKYKNTSKEDILTTFTEFVAKSIYNSYENFIKSTVILDEIIVSGGGIHNNYLINSLQNYFRPVAIKKLESLGYSSDAKEAICFAFLANETINSNTGNIPGATGANKKTILGKICLP